MIVVVKRVMAVMVHVGKMLVRVVGGDIRCHAGVRP